MKKLNVIVDLQFGSCGKGLLAGYLAEKEKPDTLITAWAPNAGHTYINAEGRKFVNIALPNGIVSPNLKRILLGPGSTINPELLMVEMDAYGDLLEGVEILIHENAAVVTEDHRTEEAQGMVGIGSTMKGVGAAAIQKIRRQPTTNNTAGHMLLGTPLEGMVVDRWAYRDALAKAEVAQIEGAQGFSLGINSGFYPYTTSRECTTAQLLSDCAIPLDMVLGGGVMKVWGVCRTYPIRVANRHDKDGHQIGWSGPCYPDQHELDWAELGREPELTTVTRLPRRIFTFSYMQVTEACRMNGVDEIFLNFANYLDPLRADAMIKQITAHTGITPSLVGYGPTVNDVMGVPHA